MPDGNFDLRHDFYIRCLLHYYYGDFFDDDDLSSSDHEYSPVDHGLHIAI